MNPTTGARLWMGLLLTTSMGCSEQVTVFTSQDGGGDPDSGTPPADVGRDAMSPRSDSGASQADGAPRPDGSAADAATTGDGGSGAGEYWVRIPATPHASLRDTGCGPSEEQPLVFEVSSPIATNCQEGGPVIARVDAEQREIHIEAWLWEERGRTDCGAAPPGIFARRTVEVGPLASGAWMLHAGGEMLPVDFRGPDLGADCTRQEPSGSACLSNCECELGLQCIPATGTASCGAQCAKPCTPPRALPPGFDGIDCGAVGSTCEILDSSVVGPRCATRSTEACATDADCPDGMECVTDDADFAASCEWSVRLYGEVRGPCTSDADCDPGLDCVEHEPGMRRCEVRCRTADMRCPASHSCNPAASVEGEAWVCGWIGE